MIDGITEVLVKLSQHFENESKDSIGHQVSSISNYIAWCIDQSDKELLSKKFLTEIQTHSNSALDNRSNANSSLSYLNNIIKIFPCPINQVRKKAESSKLIESLRNNVGEAIEDIEERKLEVEKSLADLSEKLSKNNEKLVQTEKKIEIQANRLDSLVENAQSSFDSKRTEISEKNDEYLQEAKNEFEKVLEEEHLKINDLLDKQSKKILESETLAQRHIDKLEELLGLAGDNTLTADYSRISNAEGKSVKNWSIAAVVFFSVGLIFGIIVVLSFGLPTDMSFPTLISRIVIPFSALVPGFYCATKASGHRKVQIRQRNTGVRLATLEPFLTRLSEPERVEIRKALLDEFFRQKEEVIDRRPIFGFSQKSLIELTKAVQK